MVENVKVLNRSIGCQTKGQDKLSKQNMSPTNVWLMVDFKSCQNVPSPLPLIIEIYNLNSLTIELLLYQAIDLP